MHRSSYFQVLLSSLFVLLGCLGNRANAAEPFSSWVQRFWPEAKAAGISRATFNRVFAGMTPNCRQPDVSCKHGGRRTSKPSRRRRQAEKRSRPRKRPVYSCNKVTQKEFLQPNKYFPPAYLHRLAKKGRNLLDYLKKKEPRTYRTIRGVETNLRIPHLILMGIWGRETAFGSAPLKHNAVRALASSAYAGRRGRRRWARKQLLAALKIIQRGDVSISKFRSSYAGATGLTQIMPSEYLVYGVDADFDGRKDIWHSVADSMATTANVLKVRGWRSFERTWGYEIVPGQHPINCTLEGRRHRQSIRSWVRKLGIRRAPRPGRPHPRFPNPGTSAYLLMPAGTRGPAFLVNKNFDVLRRYNPSSLYALFVGHLSDRIGCDTDKRACSFVTPWPKPRPNDFKFSVANICRMQIALKRRGFLKGKVDGLFGAKTRVAIGRYQRAHGHKLTCYPTQTLFRTLVGGKKAP
jgi:lytic murein transglycosylase